MEQRDLSVPSPDFDRPVSDGELAGSWFELPGSEFVHKPMPIEGTVDSAVVSDLMNALDTMDAEEEDIDFDDYERMAATVGMASPVRVYKWARGRIVKLGVGGLIVYNIGKVVGFTAAGWNVAPDDPVSKMGGATIGAVTSVVTSETCWGLAVAYAVKRYGAERVLAQVRKVRGLRALEPFIMRVAKGIA